MVQKTLEIKAGDTVKVNESWCSGIAFTVISHPVNHIYNVYSNGSDEWEELEEVIVYDQWVCIMVGDDRRYIFDEDLLIKIDDEDFCGGCGQLGCGFH
jgi:hypothetical protein